jgi:hypothetical protein
MRQSPAAIEHVGKVMHATGTMTSTPSTKHRVAHTPTEQGEISPPPYEPRFAKYNNMTEEMYDELGDDNKTDFIKMFVRGGKA